MAAMTLPLIFWAFSMNFGEAVQHHFQHAAQLAGLDHVDEEPVEDLGMLGQASEKVLPPSRAASSPMILSGALSRSCFSSTRKPRSSGKPASTSVANWRVKVVRTLDFTPAQAGDRCCVDFARGLLRRAAFAPAAGFLVVACSWPSLDDVGREKAHFLDPGRWPRSGWRPRACPWFPCHGRPSPRSCIWHKGGFWFSPEHHCLVRFTCI